jgi:predicted Zn-dependent protease
MLNIDSNIGRQIPGSVLEPLRGATESISRSGPIIIHGGESAIGEESAVMRSGFVPMTNSIRRSVDYLYSRYENDSATPEEIYWLAAGYVATGQIDLARDLVTDARRNGIDDLEVLNLEALIAYIGGDLERAEDLFHSIHVLYPSDGVSSINYGVVLIESGKREESFRVLGEVMEGSSGTPLAKRAEILQGID